ncbi:MAG TPA: hypothetical protein PKA82_05145 [Pyrinomonadaceae bacterium]|nr:hypothetical protein [Pyrinomonadaceae bacterium]
MNKIVKVKVIKKNEPKAEAVVVSKAVERKTSRQAAREMVSTVGDWVSEFKQRKQDETRAAIELLIQRPQTSGS